MATAVIGLPGYDAILTGFENGGVPFSELDQTFDPRVIKRRSRAAITHLVVSSTTGWLLAAAEDGFVLWGPLGRRDQ